MHKINKANIFDFLKAQSIVREVNSFIEITESRNIGTGKLGKITINQLNSNSKYWVLDPENNTFIESREKKVEAIIIEQTENGLLNIILLEMKSILLIESDILDKFTQSLHWVYLLLNLLQGKDGQSIKVYGILIAQKDAGWNSKETLNIFNSTSIRYIKRSFFTSSNQMIVSLADIVAGI